MLKKIKLKSEFTRNVLTLMTGNTIAQAIPIAISPILTRIYSPEDYGLLALYMSVFAIASTAATAKYELAIMLPKKDSDAFNLFVLSILISFFVGFITLLIVFFFNAVITNLLGNQDISMWLYLIPVSVLLTGIYNSLKYWNNRNKQFKRLATTSVLQASMGSTFNLGFGFAGFGGAGLIVSGLLGILTGTSLLARVTFLRDKKHFISLNKIKVLILLKKYKKLPLITLPNSLIDSFRLSGIMLLIAKFFTTATLGQFSLAWRMVQLPMSLLGGSISQVFFQKLSSSKQEDLYGIVKNFIIKAFFIAAPAFLILYFFSVDIFIFAFGDKWKLAGEATSTMTLWLFLNFITSPLSTIYMILNKQEVMFVFSIIYMLFPLITIFLLHNYDFLYVLSAVTYVMSFLLVALIFMTLYITYKK